MVDNELVYGYINAFLIFISLFSLFLYITSTLGLALVISYLKYLSQRFNELTIFSKGLYSSPRGIPKWLSTMSVKDEECSTKPYFSNAFDIISLSSGIDLCCLFEKYMSKKHHARFAISLDI